MPTDNRIAHFHEEMTERRRDLHAHPDQPAIGAFFPARIEQEMPHG